MKGILMHVLRGRPGLVILGVLYYICMERAAGAIVSAKTYYVVINSLAKDPLYIPYVERCLVKTSFLVYLLAIF